MATGQLKLFLEIWEETPIRRCYITNRLLKNFDHRSFAHVLPKGGYPKYMLKKENIVLMQPDIHHLQHSLGKTELIERHPKFKDFFDLQDELRSQYNKEHLKRYNRFK